VLETQLDRLLREDREIKDESLLRSRIVLPFRFPPSLLSEPNLYTDLAARTAPDLHVCSHHLTTNFKTNLSPVQVL